MSKIHTLSMGMSLAYLIESTDGMVLVDAGLRSEEAKVLRLMESLGRDDLRLIFITHAHIDHYGSAAALRALSGAKIAVHRSDAEAMAGGETRLGKARGWGHLVGAFLPLLELIARPPATAADLLLEDGDDLSDFGLDGSVLHTPGHTLGSSCLLLEDGTAFSGDLVTTTGSLHVQRAFAQDWSLVPESVRRLQSARPSRIFTGHGGRPASGSDLQKLQLQGSARL
jgi:hydroxyacylglutathione hydrolase